MEAVTAIHAYAEYQPAAKALARRFGPRSGMLDARARTQEDYSHELRLKAVGAADRFQKWKGFCLPAERRYVYKALWNRARNWRRDQQRSQAMSAVVDVHHEEALGVYEIEAQLEARQVVRVLASALSPKETVILARLVEANGVLRQAWRPELDGPIREFTRRVARIRRKAKKVAEL